MSTRAILEPKQTLTGSIYKGSNIKLDTTLTKAGMAADAKAVGERLSVLENYTPSGSGGLTVAQVNALDKLFQLAAYTQDASAAYDAFKKAFANSGGGGGTDVPDTPDTPDNPVVTYTVTNNLTNVSTTNAKATIEHGAIYAASLSADDGYEIVSATVTMGGEDVTATYYVDGAISIPSVTGDIVITAVADVPASADWNIVYCQDGSDPADKNNNAARLLRIDTNINYIWVVRYWSDGAVQPWAGSIAFKQNNGADHGKFSVRDEPLESVAYQLGAYKLGVGKYNIDGIIAAMNDTTIKSFYGDNRDPFFDCKQIRPYVYAAQREITEDMLRAITGIG